jgi:KUP system potassium uptake protein
MQTHSNQSHLNDKFKWASLLITLGIIYGDIGTSPLYVFKAIVGEREITETLVFGGVSCVFWTLVFQTTIKYVWLTLKADNQGEGGIFSLYSLIRKYGKRLVVPTMIGAAALLADGMITPAVSVTSSIEGLRMIQGLENLSVVPIVLTIISLVFFFQRLGSENMGKAFGPLMLIWFLLLMAMGILQISHYPSVLKALNPIYAYQILMEYPHGFWILGAVFLCTTGAEALYSDMGHCGRKNIRISWGFVKTCLVVNYLGQAAWLIHQPEVFLEGRNPFFEMMPQWFLLPGIIIATMAAIIASQALISGSFTLVNEAINLNFWLRVAVKQPTETKGQIYIPSVNFVLWWGCVFVILYFQTSAQMEAAYGLAITIAMMMTTYLLFFYLLFKKRWKPVWVYSLISMFAVIEVSFFIANIIKFQEGGFITVIMGGIFFFSMYVVYYGRKISIQYTKFVDIKKYSDKILELSTDSSIPKYASHLIYLSRANRKDSVEEKIMDSILNKKPKRAEVYWLYYINRTNQPYTLDYEITELIEGKFIKITMNIGFRIQPRIELYFKKIITDLIENKEFNLHQKQNSYSKYSTQSDFKFIITEKYLSVENEFKFREGFILKAYFFYKRIGQRDERAFGLDKSDVEMEYYPFVYQPVQNYHLKRKNE